MAGVNFMKSSLPPVQKAVDSTQLVEVPCFTSLPRDDQTPLEFRVERTDQHIDPSEIYLYVKCQFVATAAGTPPSCANNLGYTMWQNVEMQINDQKITFDQSLYPWMSYILCVTRYSTEYRKTALSTALWEADMWGTMDTAEGDNQGNTKRMSRIGGSFEMYTRVMTDFIHLNRLLPKQTDLLLRFVPANPDIFVLGDTAHKLKIMEARLYVSKVRLTTELPKQMHYPAQRFMGKVKIINTGEQKLDWAVHTGRRPRRLYIVQIDQKTYNGNKKMNPFNLQTFDLKRIQIFFNDLSLPTNMGTTLGPDDISRCFLNSYKAVNNPRAWTMTMEAYKYGYFLYVVDLTNDHSANSDYRSIEKHGTVRVMIDYHQPLTKAIAVMCFAEFDDVPTIDENGNPKWTA